jgi:hypothetical protein
MIGFIGLILSGRQRLFWLSVWQSRHRPAHVPGEPAGQMPTGNDQAGRAPHPKIRMPTGKYSKRGLLSWPQSDPFPEEVVNRKNFGAN